MLIIGDIIVSEVLLERKFVCNLQACKGACCVEGDDGAPVKASEEDAIGQNLEAILPFLSEEAREIIRQRGVLHKSKKGLRTNLMKSGACIFVVRDPNGVAVCGIEKAWEEGKSGFRKPLSCHLYPARETPLENATALNYEEWEICRAACTLGEELAVPVYRFLKDALIRAYGEEFYRALEGYARSKKED